MNLAILLKRLQSLGPITAAIPAVKTIVDTAIAALYHADEAPAKAVYADLIADNDAGHARLQDKLAKAGTR